MNTIKLSDIPKQVSSSDDLDGSEVFIVTHVDNGFLKSMKLALDTFKDYIFGNTN